MTFGEVRPIRNTRFRLLHREDMGIATESDVFTFERALPTIATWWNEGQLMKWRVAEIDEGPTWDVHDGAEWKYMDIGRSLP